jgi:hypothetical protein
MKVFRVQNKDGAVMHLEELGKSIDQLGAALHQLEPMPDSTPIELMGLDGSRVLFTKIEAKELHRQMLELSKVGEDA